ncbi:class II glutamine amidotransferase [Providencia rettgeri]|uniref:Class II glutamine amidotransferase n=1 Tax=Providencia rettgeri TaxID=587 RepID=A0A939NHJ9_PRORE|nr:class II glutamine amidotransferase [Providencia rettgeri]
MQEYPIKSESVVAHIRQANRGCVVSKYHPLLVSYGDVIGLMHIMGS